MTSKLKQMFTSVIDENKGIIYKVANSYCRDKEDRNDLIQEILAQLWRAFEKYDKQYKLSTWMYRISLNVAISFYRKERKHKNIVELKQEELLNIADEAESDKSEPEENVRLLYQFIGGLNKLNKAVMLLYLENESYQTIAETLGITETNVATKISRIKKKLKLQFSEQESQ